MAKDVFSQNVETKRILSVRILSAADLKLYLLMKFGTYENAAQAAGFTSERIHQICAGVDVPRSPNRIKNLAHSWDVDLVILSSLFERLRGEKNG